MASIKGTRRDNGFTLIEIGVMVIIVSALASLALPNFLTAVEVSRAREGEHILLHLYGAQKRYFLQTGGYAGNLGDLDIEIRSPDNFDLPTVAANPPLAQILRKDNTYQLEVDASGIVCCRDINPNARCSHFNYAMCS